MARQTDVRRCEAFLVLTREANEDLAVLQRHGAVYAHTAGGDRSEAAVLNRSQAACLAISLAASVVRDDMRVRPERYLSTRSTG